VFFFFPNRMGCFGELGQSFGTTAAANTVALSGMDEAGGLAGIPRRGGGSGHRSDLGRRDRRKAWRKGVLSAIICAPVTLMMALLIFAGDPDYSFAAHVRSWRHKIDVKAPR
jgi:hypothetical protein